MLNREQPTSFSNQKMADRHGKTSAMVFLKMNSLKVFLQESQISIYVLKMKCIAVKVILKLLFGKKKMFLDPRCTSIAFNHSGVMAYNYEGQIYQKMPSIGTWLPIYTNFKKQSVRTIFETS